MKNNNDIVKGWILKAENDIIALKMIMESGKALDTACFHAQQAGEKYLKSFLIFNEIDSPKTHDIERLLRLCSIADIDFLDLIDEASFLTDYAVELRYDLDFLPDKNKVENALMDIKKLIG